MENELLQAALKEALRDGQSLEGIIGIAKDAWVELNEQEATEAVIVTYIIDEPEYTSIEDADARVLSGELTVCETHGLHLNEDDEFFSWKYKAYHLERAPNERERSYMLAKMMGVTIPDDTDEYE